MHAQYERMLNGARHYAEGDKSDPFAFDRAMAHIRSGIAGLKPNGDDAFYRGSPELEQRELPSGEKYNVRVIRSMQRP